MRSLLVFILCWICILAATFDDKHIGQIKTKRVRKAVNIDLSMIKIHNNPNLKSAIFPALEKVYANCEDAPLVTIENNPQLASISFPKLDQAHSGAEKAIIVKGNEKFNNADSLYKEVSKVIEEKNMDIECFPGQDITDMSQLNGCTGVSGDLVLKGTSGASSTKLTHIDGCLKVVETSLKDLSFLALDQTPVCATESEIGGNKDMCLAWPFVKELSVKIGKTTYKADETCETTCPSADFENSDACNVLDGDLTVSGFDSNNGPGTTLPKIMAKVRKITGKLIISGNKDASIVFPELASIGNPSLTEEAILIDGNDDLKEISIPKLTTVETGGNVAVVVKGYKMTKDQAKFMKNAAGGKDIKIECDFSNKEVKDFAELDYCTSVKGDLLLKNTQGVLNTKIESIGGCLQIIDANLDNNTFYSLVSPLESGKCQSGEKSEIKGNKNLCLVWSEIKNVRNTFKNPVEFSFDESCELSCTEEEFAEEGSFCEQFNGALDINGNKNIVNLKPLFEKLKRVKGQIHLDGSTLEEVHFPKLVLVESSKPGYYAITVNSNKALRKLSMPHLSKITAVTTAGVWIVFNDGFRMSNELRTTLENALAPDLTIDYSCHESSEISDYSRLEGCTKMSSGVHIKGKITGTIPNSRISHIFKCLTVEDSDMSALDFLKIHNTTGVLELSTDKQCREEHFIRNNENLCIPPFLEQQLKDIYPALTISDNKPRDQCPVFCYAINGTIPNHECNIVKGELKIQKDCSFDQSLALVEQIDGGLLVKDCSLSKLKDILPKLQNISSSGIPLVLDNVETYSNLTDLLEFNLESENPDSPLIKIITNQEIPYMVDADLKAHFGSKRVEMSKVMQVPEGVCLFVDQPAEVKNCKTVEGDLILDEKSVSVSTEITEITGCLVVKNTNMENYEFLTKIEKIGDKCRWSEGKTGISNNTCIPYDVRRQTSGKIKELVGSEENSKGCYECVGGILPGQECKVIIGNLEINQTSQPHTDQLQDVKEIYGRLIIKNSNFPQISLTQLTKIDASESDEPAIEITGNSELSLLQMPALVNATSKGKVVVKIEENKKLKKTADLTGQLAKATRSQCGEGKGGVCQFSEVKAPEKSTEEEGVSKTVLIVLGIIGAILLVVGLAGVAVMVVLIKKKQANKPKKALGPGKPPKSTMSKVDTSKTKSVALETGTKSNMKSIAKDAVKGEDSKKPEPSGEKKETDAPAGAPAENAPPQNVPNAL